MELLYSGRVLRTVWGISELPKEINVRVFYDQILKLQKTKRDYEVKLSATKTEEVNFDLRLNVDEFKKFTSDLKLLASKTTDPNIQASICRKLVKKVDVSTTGITIHYHVGDHHFEKEVGRAIQQNRGLVGSDIESSSKGLVGVKPAGPKKEPSLSGL